MAVELVDARVMCAACALGMEPRTKQVKLVRCTSSPCDDSRARAMAVELEQWRWSSCDGHQACATMATLMELVRCLWSTLKAMTCYIFSVVSV